MNPQLTSSQLITDFLNKLLDEAGMDTVSPEVRSQMMEDLQARLNDRLFATVLMNLTEDKVQELRDLTEKDNSPEALQKFIDNNISDSQAIFSQAMLTFRVNYLGLK